MAVVREYAFLGAGHVDRRRREVAEALDCLQARLEDAELRITDVQRCCTIRATQVGLHERRLAAHSEKRNSASEKLEQRERS